MVVYVNLCYVYMIDMMLISIIYLDLIDYFLCYVIFIYKVDDDYDVDIFFVLLVVN